MKTVFKTAFLASFILLLGISSGPGCLSAYRKTVGEENEKVFTKIYVTDFNTAWQAVLDALKSVPLEISNREAGYIQTGWKENTFEKNFADSFGIQNAKSYLKAQYRVKVSVASGFFNGRPSVKLSLQKDQMVQKDVLEGWRTIPTDEIDENTMLYRIGRIINNRMRLAKMEEEKTKRAVESSGF